MVREQLPGVSAHLILRMAANHDRRTVSSFGYWQDLCIMHVVSAPPSLCVWAPRGIPFPALM